MRGDRRLADWTRQRDRKAQKGEVGLRTGHILVFVLQPGTVLEGGGELLGTDQAVPEGEGTIPGEYPSERVAPGRPQTNPEDSQRDHQEHRSLLLGHRHLSVLHGHVLLVARR